MTPSKLTAVLVLAAAVAGLSTAGCAGHSMKRVNPSADDDVGGTLIDSADVIASTDRATSELVPVLLQSQQNDLVVAPATIKNETVQPFNTAMLTDRMIDHLVRGCGARVKFLAREHIDEVLKERDAKRQGVYSATEQKALLGAHYLLTGRITSLSKRADGDRADYFVLAFRLVDAEDSHLVWTQNYEFKKVGDAGVIYQ
jgi:curli biogenesis system outer membrane secretion channel CsgG